MVDSTFSICIPALIEGAERDPRLRTFHHRYSATRRQSLIDVIAEGVATGELPAGVDPELAALALLGPIFYLRLMSAEPFDPARAGALVDTVLGPQQKRRGPGDGRPLPASADRLGRVALVERALAPKQGDEGSPHRP